MRVLLLDYSPDFVIRGPLVAEMDGSSGRVDRHGTVGHLVKEIRQAKISMDVLNILDIPALRLHNMLNGDLLVRGPGIERLSRITLLILIVGGTGDDD